MSINKNNTDTIGVLNKYGLVGNYGFVQTSKGIDITSGNNNVLQSIQTTTRYYNVLNYGAKGDGSTDDTKSVSAAIQASQQTAGSVIYFPSGTYVISSSLPTITQNSTQIIGQGVFGATTIDYRGTGNIFLLSSQKSSISNIYFNGFNNTFTNVCTAISLINCYECFVDTVRFDAVYTAIKIQNSTQCKISNIEMRYISGNTGILFGGGVGEGCFRVVVDNISCDNPIPNGEFIPKTFSVFTAYNSGDMVSVGGKVYQCIQSGTTNGSGTLVLPSGKTCTQIFFGPEGEATNGTSKWKYVNTNLVWIKYDSFAYSAVFTRMALINGLTGILMTDTVNSGTSYPIWIFGYDIECDHNFGNAIELNRGEGVYFSTCWFGSSGANGIKVNSGFRGEVSVVATRIMGCTGIGAYVDGTKDIIFSSCFIGKNANDANIVNASKCGVFLQNTQNVTFSGNRNGDLVGGGGNAQRYGIIIQSDCSYVVVCGENLRGNVTSGVLNNIANPALYRIDANNNFLS